MKEGYSNAVDDTCPISQFIFIKLFNCKVSVEAISIILQKSWTQRLNTGSLPRTRKLKRS